MGTFGDSWQLTRASVGVLFPYPALLGFTFLSALADVGILAATLEGILKTEL